MTVRGFSLLLLVFAVIGATAQTTTIDEMSINVVCASPRQAVCTFRQVITIQNEQGASFAGFAVRISKGDQLKSFSGQAVNADGQIIRKFKKGDLMRTEYSSMLAMDDYMMLLDFTPPSYPITISYEWTEQMNDDLIELPRFVPQTDYGMAVKQASYTVSTPADFPIRYHLQNISQTVEQHVEGGRQLTTLTIRDLPALDDEPRSRKLSERLPMAWFAPTDFYFYGHQGSLSSWQEYGKWTRRLLEDRQALPDAIRQKVHQLTDSCSSPRGKVAQLYDFLRQTTRYVSIQLGIGGLQPAAAADVARTGYGDCKALSNYMRALLQEAGIESVYAEISTVNTRLLPDFPNVGQLNHVILQVPLPGDTLWLECTNPALPLGYVHEDIAGHDAVLITPDGGRLQRLPSYTDSLHLQHSQMSIQLMPDGSATMSLEQTSHFSQYESMVPLAKMNAADRNKAVLNAVRLQQPEITNLSVKAEDDVPLVTLQAELSCSRYASATGRRLFVPLCPLHKGFKAPSLKEDRQENLIIYDGYLDTDDFVIDLPEGFDVESLPADISESLPFAEFTFSLRREGRKLHLRQRLLVHSGTFEKTLFPDYVALMKKVETTYGQRIVLILSTQ
jgi:hypothetical protein